MDDHIQPVLSEQGSNPPPFKKRKFYRRRTPSEGERDDRDSIATPPSATAPEAITLEELIAQGSQNAHVDADSQQEKPLSVAEILRQRRAIQRRKAGIEFRNVDAAGKVDNSGAQTRSPLPKEDDTLDRMVMVVDRFAPQTGQVADVDQHMYAITYRPLLDA